MCRWIYSPIKPFQPSSQLRKILFAPIHPNGNSWLSKIDIDLNRRTYEILLEVCQRKGIELHIRYIGQLTDQGLYPHHFPKFMQAVPDLTHNILNDYDLVVGHQTFAFISVAVGKPTLMMGEWNAPRNGKSDASVVTVTSWDKYKDLVMFPLDILDTLKPEKLMLEACKSDDMIRDWKQSMIGDKPFDDHAVVRAVCSYV